MSEFIAYLRVADTGYVLDASDDYPRRATFDEAVQDAQAAWHEHGQHLTVYEIGPDGSVKEAGK